MEVKKLPSIDIIERIGEYGERLESLMVNEDAKYNKGLRPSPKVIIDFGRRYAKIIREDSQKSVHSFIDLKNGDILKAASWAQPAKHARGSIFAEDYGLSAVNPYSANYLK